MKRDLDLTREIMLALEQDPKFNGRALRAGYAIEYVKLQGRTDDELAYHLMLILDEKWVDGKYDAISGRFFLTRLTADGHDFIDSTRRPDTWEKAKSIAKSSGAETLRFVWDVAKSIVKAEVARRMGS